MNIPALIPLIAAIAYIPLFAILLANRPLRSQQRLFLLFLIPAIAWSLADIFARSDLFMPSKLLFAKLVLFFAIWMMIQYHYFLRSFYQTRGTKIPLVYCVLAGSIVLLALGYIPSRIDIDPITNSIHVAYGNWILLIAAALMIVVGKDIYSLWQKRRVSANAVERNQINYLFLGLAALAIFGLVSMLAPFGGKYPLAHIGNLAMACALTYSVMAHRLLDVRVALRQALFYIVLYSTGIAIMVLVLVLVVLISHIELDLATAAIIIGLGIPIVAFVAHKLRNPWRDRIEQAFIGQSYRYRRQLSEFIDRIHSVPTLEQFGSQLTSLLCQSVNCRRACLLLPEAGDFTTRFTYPPLEDNPMAELKLRQDSPIVTWLGQKAQLLSKRNLSVLPEFQSLWQEEKEGIQSAKVETFLPVINRGELVAVFAVSDKQNSQLYTVEDIDLLDSVASRVAASMEKEYFHEQLREQDKELTLINRLTTIITSSMSIQEIFQAFADELKKFVDIDWATIALIEGDKLYVSALSSTIGSPWQPGEEIQLEGTATEWVCREKKSLYEADLARFHKFWTGQRHFEQGIHSIIYLPLTLKDTCIGSLSLASRRPNAYSPKQVRLLEQLALQIATPIENSQLYAKAEQRSRIDELTELFNRRHFEERLKEELARHSRYGGVFSLVLLDLDNFKTYNDIYGHPSGDKLLNQIARIVKKSIRSGDQAFRYGGDEIVVILPQTTTEDAYTVAERMREQIAAEMEAKEVAVTCSIGLASYPSDGVISGELVTVADTALYYAKRTGGNRVYLSSKILSEPAAESGIDARGSGLSAVYALASAVEARDAYTYGHSRKVNTYAVALAEAIGLAPDEVSKVSTAALLHDIGKIGVSDKILNKKGKPSDEDWKAIKLHPRLGANIIGNVPSLVSCVGGLLYHHEWWDGTGYPEGLAGEQIPLEARILAITDAFAAMTSARPYRDAFCDDKVIKELKEGAGTQFDPKLVEAFLHLIESGFPERVKVGQKPSSEKPSQ
jgi:diguanylate cyclase (GGDEF)-like protein